jgi:hypothetical protein
MQCVHREHIVLHITLQNVFGFRDVGFHVHMNKHMSFHSSFFGFHINVLE